MSNGFGGYFFRSGSGGAAALGTTTEPNALFNLGLSNSVAANALTIALKQSDGSTDPSSGANAVNIGMRNVTATSGLYNQRSVTAALSLVLTSGTTLGLANGVSTNIWIYAIDSDGAGTMKLGASTVQYDETQPQTTVAESASVTCTNASPCVVTESAHGRINNQKIRLTGTPPTGFSTGTDYYIVNKAANTYQLSATPGGTAINSTSTGTSVVAHVADWALASNASYVSMPIRIIGCWTGSEATAGTWLSAATNLSSGLQPAVSPSARYFASATSISGSLATVAWTTKDFDMVNIHLSGTFVIPQPGKWQVNSAIAIAMTSTATNTGGVLITININGTIKSAGNTIGVVLQTQENANVADTISLVAGDLVTIKVSSSSTGPSILSSNTQNYVSLIRISS